MKNIALVVLLGIFPFFSFSQQKSEKEQKHKSIHKFKVNDINGNSFDFSTLAGKKIMIVNTASRCGFTKQFEGLQELYEKYKDSNFVIIGFPSNDFLNQDPGTDKEILEFCTINYGVSFPMMSKVKVTGKKKAPIYKFLTDGKSNGVQSSTVSWNFQKYLIDENGYLVKVINTKTDPLDIEIINWIEGK
ncbi:MAG TPA: glutathione peroxidase [Bacteroidales bacterium]|nr:glutathione peroxidase [Bacteroidales bacterium]